MILSFGFLPSKLKGEIIFLYFNWKEKSFLWRINLYKKMESLPFDFWSSKFKGKNWLFIFSHKKYVIWVFLNGIFVYWHALCNKWCLLGARTRPVCVDPVPTGILNHGSSRLSSEKGGAAFTKTLTYNYMRWILTIPLEDQICTYGITETFKFALSNQRLWNVVDFWSV